MKTAGFLKLGVALLLSGIVSTQVWAMSDAKKQAIADRIKPVGTVCVEGDASCASASGASTGGAARSGEEIYNASCLACHTTGAAGAPKIGDKADWSKRMASGIDKVYEHAIKGFNAMPAMGLCMTCSEDEIKATVDYILEKSK